jgi:D-3-phosphoglycerate dehydrogenase
LSPIIVFDFDSTLVQFESFPELARISLKNHPERADRLAEIERITELTASGGMSMGKGIALRIDLLDGHRKHLEKLSRSLKRSMTPSVKRNRAFFKKYLKKVPHTVKFRVLY